MLLVDPFTLVAGDSSTNNRYHQAAYLDAEPVVLVLGRASVTSQSRLRILTLHLGRNLVSSRYLPPAVA